MRDTINVVRDPKVLRRVNVMTAKHEWPKGETLAMEHPSVKLQQETVETQWRLQFSLAHGILDRFAEYIKGWPTRCYMLGHREEEVAEAAAAELLEDHRVFREMAERTEREAGKMFTRSGFQLRPTQQSVKMMQGEGGVSDPKDPWLPWKTACRHRLKPDHRRRLQP